MLQSGILRGKKWSFPVARRLKTLWATGEMTNIPNISAFLSLTTSLRGGVLGKFAASFNPLRNQPEIQDVKKRGKPPKLPGIVRRNTPRAPKVIFFFFFLPWKRFFYGMSCGWSSVAKKKKCPQTNRGAQGVGKFPQEQIPGE